MYPYHYRPRRPAKSGDSGDSGDDPDAGDCRTSLKAVWHSRGMHTHLVQLFIINLFNVVSTIILSM